MPPPVWELTPGVQGHDDLSVDVRDLSVPVSGSQKAVIAAVVLTALLLRGPSPVDVRQRGPGRSPPWHGLRTPTQPAGQHGGGPPIGMLAVAVLVP